MPVAAKFPKDEDARIQVLKRYDLLDTEAEKEFDTITSLVADIFDAPIVLVSLVDSCRQWFKSRVGLEAQETHRNLAFCAHAILEEDVLYVEDATKDDRFADSPLVLGGPNIRTYAGAPLQTYDGYRLGTLCIIYDEVTPLSPRQLDQLNQFSNVVMDAIEARLSQLQTEELKLKAEQANENKSRFVAMISHELRTPMNGVLNMLEFLKKEELTDKQREYVDIVHQSSSGLLAIINDILDFSKLSAGKFELDRRPFKLSDTITFVCSLLRQQAHDKGLYLTHQLDPNLPTYGHADDVRLRQILYNLVGNAVKFTENGGVTITVEDDSTLGENHVRFSVLDTGIGIEPDRAKQLFECYQQGDISVSRKFGGTGLGLAICKQLAELMGGQIGVCESKDGGTLVWVSVPIPECRATQKAADKKQDDALPPLSKEATALVVEDNAINRTVLEKVLSNYNIKPTMATNGHSALNQLERMRPDIILMDIEMPELDGLSATKMIREKGAPFNDLPIIAISANAMDEQVQHYLDTGMTDFVAKPFKTSDLIETVYKYLGDYR